MTLSLTDLGWSNHFARQTYDDGATPYRLAQVHRDRLVAFSPEGEHRLIPADRDTRDYAVGDWVWADDDMRVLGTFERHTVVQRKAAGHQVRPQLIAANVDTLFIVSSCNQDFNIARLERYLALGHSAGCYCVVVLTKADMAEDVDFYKSQIYELPAAQAVEVINAKDPEDVARVAGWVTKGQTGALLGSSGVGKTTLTNALTGSDDATAGIREDDARGRHTTTFRALKPMLNGGWLIDTPGMRELQLFAAEEGLEQVFEDITDLAKGCKFRDCEHISEPGCQVRAAIDAGTLTEDRLERWRKLERELAHNAQTLQENRKAAKEFTKRVNRAQKSANLRKKRR